MATERQIEANRRNAALSTGPTTEEGKARSRANATKHGLAGVLPEAEGEIEPSPEFVERRAQWAAEYRPSGEAGGWALDRAVSAALRIERCERALDQVIATVRTRALHSWDEDRAVEAATIAARLAKDPVLASRRLRASLAGVVLLIEAWSGLVAALEGGCDWSEADASTALDLLGVAADLRSGRTLIDPCDGTDPVIYRRALAFEEIERLESVRDESMAPLDELERRRDLAGDVAILSKPARLVLRYERDAWRRYREAMKEVEASRLEPPAVAAPAPAPVMVAPPPAVVEPPRVPEPSVPAIEEPGPRPDAGEGRRPEVAATPTVVPGRWMVGYDGQPLFVPERTQFAATS